MTLRIIFCSLCVSLSLNMGLGYENIVYAQQEFFPFLAEVTGDRVNVRSGQSANFERVCQLNKDDEVVVLEKEYSWYKVQLPPTAKSFVSKKYVQYLGQNAGGIVADRVNIRAGAGIHHTVLGQLAKGEQIYIEEELDEWYRISPVAESYGWIADKFLSFKSNDVAEYRSKAYLKPSFDEELFEPVEEQAEEEEQEVIEEQEVVEEQEEENFFDVGYVEAYEDEDNDGIHYKIVENGRPVCYILGVNHILGRFIHQKVSVEGTINKRLQSKYVYPVIIVSTVRLML